MNRCQKRIAVAACLISLTVPSQSQAHLFSDWCPPGTTVRRPFFTTTFFRPFGLFRRPVCDPCAVTFAPQTTFRAVPVSVPVTTFQPVCAVDPCTGCPVTTMRPVTSFVQQVRRVPVTTLRPVVACRPICPTPMAVARPCPTAMCPQPAIAGFAPAACPGGACPPASPATFAAGATTAGFAPAAAGCCPGAAPTTTFSPPATVQGGPAATFSPPAGQPTTTFSPPPATTHSQPATQPAPSTSYSPPASTYSPPSTTYSPPAQNGPAPTYGAPATQIPYSPPSPAPQTFAPENQGLQEDGQGQPQNNAHPQHEPPLEPTPQGEGQKTRGLFRAPLLHDPQDRTAVRPTPGAVTHAVFVQPAAPSQEELDAEGWRPARAN